MTGFYLTRIGHYNSVCILFFIDVFLPAFFDIARYAYKKADENTLNIKQKYRLYPNNRLWFKKT